MTRKGITENNDRRLALIKKFSVKRAALKEKIRDPLLSYDERTQCAGQLARLPANSSATRYRRRCALTGRGNGNFRHFGICRIQIRNLAAYIPGLMKSSW